MLEILFLKNQDEYYEQLIEYALNCPWRAGSSLADKMKNNYFIGWQRVIVALIDQKIAGFATFVECDSIKNNKYQPFIGYVYVDEQYRGRRLSEKMIDEIINYAKMLGFKSVYVHSGELGLYEKFGFKIIDSGITNSGKHENIYEKMI